ncbi:MAG: preprotein translocase subunit YajC [Verrucomicrobia bacterium]|nr:preprotein translocase subunit YajC [Verrucomicrobiota bacterium]
MNLNTVTTFLAEAGAAPAQKPAPPPVWTNIVPLLLMVVVFYFILIRPQQKKAKDHASLLKTLRSGDKIVTSGGVVGVVITVKEKTVSLRSADTKLEVLKSAISEITERGGEATAS